MNFIRKNKSSRICYAIVMAVIAILLIGGKPSIISYASDNANSVSPKYIINTRTGKIHASDCQYIDLMSDKNKYEATEPLSELVKQNYVICRKCHAGIQKSFFVNLWDQLFHSNMYGDEVDVVMNYEEYISAINEMGEWYVNHVPTYASNIQDESLLEYSGTLKNYTDYQVRDKKGKNKQLKVLSADTSSQSTKLLASSDKIACGSENAIKYYDGIYENIIFDSKIAYYPCDLISKESDYCTPGDDCVRFLFAVFNMADGQFTKKYAQLTKRSYSKTNSQSLAINRGDIAYGMINLGFEIYDQSESIVRVDGDKIPDGYINKIDSNFKLKKGDIMVREGHVHIYLGNGSSVEAENFGWGRVYRSFPQQYNIQVVDNQLDSYRVQLINNKGNQEYYTRVYRFVGNTRGGK